MEFIELKDHNFFIVTQAHPEFSSKPLRPNPLITFPIGGTAKLKVKDKVELIILKH